MNHAARILAAALACLTTAASAQFVKGNEAVRILPDGSRQVETPPMPAGNRGAPCAATANCHPGPWHMVETSEGLQECTEPFARPTSCRASTYGAQRISRVWVAKHQSRWFWCQRPSLEGKCVDMNARPPLNLPVSAVQ